MPVDLAAVFGAGLLTYLTPCVLPLMPIYLTALASGDVSRLGALGRGQLLARAVAFALGFIAVFTAMGLAASSAGALLTEHRLALMSLGGVVVTLFGLKLLGVIQIPWLDRVVRADDNRWKTRWTSVNALGMGILFAAGWSPCVGPVLGTVLTYTASTTSDPLIGAGYLAAYGAGFALPLLMTATFAEVGLGWIRRLGPILPKLERATGVLMLLVAASLLFDFNPTAQPAPVFAAAAREQALADASPRATPTLLELYSSECPICREMEPIVAQVASECESDAVDIRLVDVSRPENRRLMQKYRLVGVPTFLFLDENETEVARLVGKQSHEALHQALSALRGESCSGVGHLPPTLPTEETSCHSTITSAPTAATRSNGSSDSPSAPSLSTVPSVASAANACSLALP